MEKQPSLLPDDQLESDKEFEADIVRRLQEFGETEEYKSSPAANIAKSQRYEKKVQQFANRSGLQNIDPESAIGKLIRERGEVFDAMASKNLHPAYVEKLIYIAIEAEMAKDAALTWLFSLKAPKKPTDEGALSHRQSYQTATTAYKGFASLLIEVMQLLQSGQKVVEAPQKLTDRIKELTTSVKKRS